MPLRLDTLNLKTTAPLPALSEVARSRRFASYPELAEWALQNLDAGTYVVVIRETPALRIRPMAVSDDDVTIGPLVEVNHHALPYGYFLGTKRLPALGSLRSGLHRELRLPKRRGYFANRELCEEFFPPIPSAPPPPPRLLSEAETAWEEEFATLAKHAESLSRLVTGLRNVQQRHRALEAGDFKVAAARIGGIVASLEIARDTFAERAADLRIAADPDGPSTSASPS